MQGPSERVCHRDSKSQRRTSLLACGQNASEVLGGNRSNKPQEDDEAEVEAYQNEDSDDEDEAQE